MNSPTEILVDDPTHDTVHHPYSACNQGFDAYEQGLPIDVNPYPPGREQDWWEMGWEEAKEQDETNGSGDNDPLQPSPPEFDKEPEADQEGVEESPALAFA